MHDLIIIGNGGHSKIVIDILEEREDYNILGIITKNKDDETGIGGYPILGNDNVLQPMDIFEMEGVSDPQISPDGSKILYVRSGSDVMKDKRYSNIWIIPKNTFFIFWMINC